MPDYRVGLSAAAAAAGPISNISGATSGREISCGGEIEGRTFDVTIFEFPAAANPMKRTADRQADY